MPRNLAAEEAALWAQVTATVRPLRDRVTLRSATPTAVVRTAPQPAPMMPSPPPRPKPAPPSKSRPAACDTLDGGWDRRLGSGRIVPDQVIDLHGLSRETARTLLLRRVDAAERLGQRILLVITGKGQMPGAAPADLMPGQRPPPGAIRASLPRWLGEDAVSPRIAAVRAAHPRHGGGGAVYLILKRPR